MSVYNTNVGGFFAPQLTQDLVNRICTGEGVCRPFDISIIFVDDDAILKLNQEFLDHTDLTDVISFNLSESDADLEGEVYVCLTQAERQANEYGIDFENETSRLIIHGVLHLLGYSDETDAERQKMHLLENRYLESSVKTGSNLI